MQQEEKGVVIIIWALCMAHFNNSTDAGEMGPSDVPGGSNQSVQSVPSWDVHKPYQFVMFPVSMLFNAPL